MEGYGVFILFLGGYITLLIATGYYFNRRQTSLREFLQAGRRAGGLSLGFSAAASWLTAGALLAVIGFFMLLGMGSIWGFVAPNIIALFLLAFLVKKIKSIPAMTQPEILEIRYGSFLRTPVALIIIVVMILFAVADIKGFALVLQIFYNIDELQAALIVGLSVAVYVTLGGLSAVLATDVVQFLCLSLFVLIMALVVIGKTGDVSGVDLEHIVGSVEAGWWNPLSIGLPMVLIFCLAIIPGWVTEQDPWQKIWAAKDVRSARWGMVFGSFLVTIVFGGCAVIALGLHNIYPEIAQMGFPMGMAKAEPALLVFIMEQGFSHVVVALCALALATAAMSCADTFAASGGSCIARDIYQRYLNPSATMKEMVTVNRLSVLCIIAAATAGSFIIDSIIDAIHIATFIASASYFFVLMGGLYWKRGTEAGAVVSMVLGFVVQVAFIIIDLILTKEGAPPYLESLHPLFMGHGVIVAMTLSGVMYVIVSLATEKTKVYRLAPFFKDEAQRLSQVNNQRVPVNGSPMPKKLFTINQGKKVYLRATIELPPGLVWQDSVSKISDVYPHWISLAGIDSMRRCTRPDINSCVTLIRGDTKTNCWLEIEGAAELLEELRKELGFAYQEIGLIRETNT